MKAALSRRLTPRLRDQLSIAVKSSLLKTPLEPVAYFLSAELTPLICSAFNPALASLHSDNKFLLKSISRVAATDMRCIDVGAHIGFFLRVFEKLAPAGRHIAVEPLAAKAQMLRRKFPDAEIFECALAESSGRAVFVEELARSALSGLRVHRSDDADVRECREIEIETRTLDEIALAGPRAGLIKIDAEGAECAIVRGGARLIARDRPVILFECGAFQSPVDRCGAVFDELAAHGYRIFTVKDFALGGPNLSREAFNACRRYPAVTFNFAAAP